MKRVSYEAGWGELRGNVSGSQKLQYPTNNQGAYESVPGQKNYASNYKPRVIISKRAATGELYFSIRKKTANHLTAKSKKAMALLGGAGAIYAAILKSQTLLPGIELQYQKVQELGDTRTFRQYVMDKVRAGLIAHAATFDFTGPATPVSVDNPWGKFSGALNIQVGDNVRVKFWTELVQDGIAFTVDGMKGVAQKADDFDTVLGSNYNVLALAKDGSNYVRLGSASGSYVIDPLDEDAYVLDSNEIVSNNPYATTTTSPA